jgi:hypothetical protein
MSKVIGFFTIETALTDCVLKRKCFAVEDSVCFSELLVRVVGHVW